MAVAERHVSPAEWVELEGEAVRHGLAPLLYRAMRPSLGTLSVPAAVADGLRDVYLHSALRNSVLHAELSSVLGALRGDGVEVVVLKGAFLASGVYDDPALRPMADVDLLVRVGDLGRTEDVLRALGYAPSYEPGADREALRHHHLPRFVKPGAFPVEVHWTPLGHSIAPSLQLEPLWRAARTAKVAGTEVLVLSPEYLLHHLCMHAAAHRFRLSLLHLHDVALVVRRHPGLDWDAAAALAPTAHERALLRVGLSLAERILPCGEPALRLKRPGDDETAERVASTVWGLVTGPPRDFPWSRATLGGLGGVRARAEFLVRGLFPPARQVRARHGLPPGSRRVYGYYLLRAADFLLRWGGAALRMAAGASDAGSSRERLRRWASVIRWMETPDPGTRQTNR